MRNLIASLALFVALAAQGQLIVNGNFENMGVWSLDGWTVAEGDSAWPEAWASPEGQAWSMHAQKGGISPQTGLVYQAISNAEEGDTIDFSGWVMPAGQQNMLSGMGFGLKQSGWVTMAQWLVEQPTSCSIVFQIPLGDWTQMSGTFVVPPISPGDTIVFWLYVGENGTTETLFDAISLEKRVQQIQQAGPNFDFGSWNPAPPTPTELDQARSGGSRLVATWPNPAFDRATIQLGSRPTSVTAYSASGQATQIPVDWNGSAVVGLEALAPGSYTILAICQDGTSISRINVER